MPATPDFPERFRLPANAGVLAHVRDLSAHSDVVSELQRALKSLGAVECFCPDAAAYRVVVAATDSVIFAFASGMNTVAFRLEALLKTRALASGAAALPAAGESWVTFTLFRADWPAHDLSFWARKAYVFARESPGE